MNEKRPRVSDELGPYVDRVDCEGIDRMAERLWGSRPYPRDGFRTELGRSLTENEASARPWSGRRLRIAVAAYGAGGLALLGIAAIGVGGAGPLGF